MKVIRDLRLCWVVFRRWIRKEPKGFYPILNLISLFIVFSLAWSGLTITIAKLLEIQIPATIPEFTGYTDSVVLIFVRALKEEITFRWIYLTPLVLILKKREILILLLMAVMSSFVFGLGHYYLYHENFPGLAGLILALINQGFGGFLLSILFIKCASIARFSFQPKALIVVTFAHLIINTTIYMMVGEL